MESNVDTITRIDEKNEERAMAHGNDKDRDSLSTVDDSADERRVSSVDQICRYRAKRRVYDGSFVSIERRLVSLTHIVCLAVFVSIRRKATPHRSESFCSN